MAQALSRGARVVFARRGVVELRDVAVPEPLPPEHELWDLENLLITFHVAGGTQYEDQYMLDIFRENLKRFLSGDLPLRNQVEKKGKGF